MDAGKSRPHCQLKYWNHIPSWAQRVACRSHTGGLPYCWRGNTSHGAFNVVGSPSLMGGDWAARSGRKRYNDKPTIATSSNANTETQMRGRENEQANAATDRN